MSTAKKAIVERKKSLRELRRYYKNIAKELLYPDEVLDDIDKATTEDEMSRIMTNARHGEYDI